MRDGPGFARLRLGCGWKFLLSLPFSARHRRGIAGRGEGDGCSGLRRSSLARSEAESIPPLGPSLWKFPTPAPAGKGLSRAGAPRCSPQSPPLLAGSPNQQRWDLIPRNARAGQAGSGKGLHEPAGPERGAGTSLAATAPPGRVPGIGAIRGITLSGSRGEAQSCVYPRGCFHGSYPWTGRATGRTRGGRAILIHEFITNTFYFKAPASAKGFQFPGLLPVSSLSARSPWQKPGCGVNSAWSCPGAVAELLAEM